MITYAWKPRTMMHTDPQTAGEECARLAEENRLTPQVLLDENREEGTPLHDEFEWDDSVAAENYRLDQAANIIRAIVTQPTEEEPVEVRAFVHVTEETSHYTPIHVVLQSAEMTAVLLADAFRDFQRWRQKYQDFEKLAPIFDAAQSVMDKLKLEV